MESEFHASVMSTDGPCDQLLQQIQQYATGELETECDSDIFELHELLGEEGGPAVMLALATGHHYGWGVNKDLDTAIDFYVRAVELGCFEALDRLWNMRDDPSVQAKLQQMFRGFSQKAEQNSSAAQFNAGYCCFFSVGTAENKAEARELFLKAANQGCADAVLMLDWCRHEGIGDGYMGKQGLDLLRYAAELGSTAAQFLLGYAYDSGETNYGLVVEKDSKQAIAWFQKAASRNHISATYYLACHYYDGNGVEKDSKKAFKLWKQTALMGDRVAQDYVSCFYMHEFFSQPGQEWPVGIDYYEAAYWNRKAADQNEYYAKYTPGILDSLGLAQFQICELVEPSSSFESAGIWFGIARQYEIGIGVRRNSKKAFNLYRLAARFGSIPAIAALGRCYEQGIGTDVAPELAAHWHEKAAMRGNSEVAELLLRLIQPELADNALQIGSAFVSLAECYETGSGVARNEGVALLMREHAAANGDIILMESVANAYISGKGNKNKIGRIGSMLASAQDMPYDTLHCFLEAFQYQLDELDTFSIAKNAATAVRKAIMAIRAKNT